MERLGFVDRERDVGALIRAALEAADPAEAVLRHAPGWLGEERIVLVGAGKASLAMTRGVLERFGGRVVRGAITAVPERMGRAGVGEVEVHPADHPLPTARNVAAAERIGGMAASAGPEETLLVVLSGGGSAHLTWPAEGLTLEDLREVSSGLMRAGATIGELNTVRKHCERLKGGRLAAMALREGGAKRVCVLALSDVIGDRLDVIASGPCAPDPTAYAAALGVLERRGVRVPSVAGHLEAGARGERPETPKPGEALFGRVEHVIVGSNAAAVRAVAAEARAMGFEVVRAEEGVEGEAGEVGRRFADRMRQGAGRGRACCWVLGGEMTVTVGPGRGRGGPCTEMALAAAVGLEGAEGVAVAAFATDGIDGPTDAAGAVVDGGTCAAARGLGLHPVVALREHDSLALLERVERGAGAGTRVLRTGPTGTNVNQLLIGLSYGG